MKRRFYDLSIRFKLFLSLFIVLSLVMTITFGVLHRYWQKEIKDHVHHELTNSSLALRNMVEASTTTAVRNFLRARIQGGMATVNYFYQKKQNGELSEEEAKQQAASLLLKQSIGSSGYFYVVDTKGILQVHPKTSLVYTDVSRFDWLQVQLQRKHGYLEYDWKNPDDAEPRHKALFMEYFEPWDWIVSASCYRDEFQEFINPADFREAVLSMKHGKDGYSYLIDDKGNLVLHPFQEGENILAKGDKKSREDFERLISLGNGLISYSYQNRIESEPMTKWARIHPVRGLPWYVVSTFYVREIDQRLNQLHFLMMVTLLISLALLALGTWWISRYLTARFNHLIQVFQTGIDGDLSIRSSIKEKDELGIISDYLNRFLAGLEESQIAIIEELTKHKRTKEELEEHQDQLEKIVAQRTADLERANHTLKEDNQRRSEAEEALRGILDNMRSALIIHDQDGKIVEVNRRMLELFGLDYDQAKRASIFSDLSMPQNPIRYLPDIWKTVLGGETKTFEWMGRRPLTAEAFPLELVLKPIHYYNQNLILASLTDITEKRAVYDMLEQSEKKFRQLYQGNRDAVMVMGENVFTECNPATLEMFGVEEKSLFIGKKPDQFSPEFQPDGTLSTSKAAEMIRLALEQGSHSFEWLHCRADGTPFPASVKLSVVEFEDKNIIQALVRDITEQKQVEERLEASRSFMDAVIENLPDPLFIKDQNHRLIHVNEAFCRMMGHPRDEILNKTDYDLFPKEEAEIFWKMDDQLLAGNSPNFSEENFTDSSGLTHLIHTKKTKICDGEGNPLILGTIRDVTDLKKVQDQLQLIRTAIDHSSDAICIRNPDGKPIYHNKKFKHLFQIPTTITSDGLKQLFQEPGIQETIERELKSGSSWSGEVTMKISSGSTLPVWLRSDAVVDTDGKVLAYIGIFTDVSEKRSNEKKMEELNRRLVETAHFAGKAELATDVLHNVGNILNSVNITTEVMTNLVKTSICRSIPKATKLLDQHEENLPHFLTEDPKGKRLPEYFRTLRDVTGEEYETMVKHLNTLSKHVDHIKSIVSMQQDYAKVSGMVEPVDLAETIEDAIRIQEMGFSRHGVRLEKDLAEIGSIPTERQKILQILVNLLSNAKQAVSAAKRSEGKVWVHLREDDDNQVLIQIRDNGIGITQEQMEKIFQHGFTTRREGHGFGLHSSANIASQLGGALKSESEGTNQGACFTLVLPKTIHHQEEESQA